MTDRQTRLQQQLLRDLAELRLTQIAATYREVLDEAARQNSSTLEILAGLVALEVTHRQQQALERRIQRTSCRRARRSKTTTSTSPDAFPNKRCSACLTVSSSGSIASRC